MDSSFAQYVYDHIIGEHEELEDDLTIEDVETAEDALCLDELDLTSDDLDTWASAFRQACESQGIEPDFTGYEDY